MLDACLGCTFGLVGDVREREDRVVVGQPVRRVSWTPRPAQAHTPLLRELGFFPAAPERARTRSFIESVQQRKR